MKNFNILSKARWLVLPILAILCSTQMWGAAGDVLKTYNTNSSTFGSGYARQSGDNFNWWGQKNYYGANNATNHAKLLPTATDLPVVKAHNSSASTSTTGLYYLYTTEAVSNVGAIQISFSAKSGSSTVKAYVVSSSTKAASGSATWTKLTLLSTSSSAQGANVANSGTYTFVFPRETSAKYYGVVFVTSSYWRATGLTMKLIEGSPAPTSVVPGTIGTTSFGLTITDAQNINNYDICFKTNSTAPTATTTATTTTTSKIPTISSGVSASTTYYVWVRSVKTVNSVTYKSAWVAMSPASLATLGSSYTVGWSITDGGGTLSTTSGMSTTVTPTSGYRYASPAYTVLTGSASVSQSTNTFTATPTANSTIRINMEQIPSHNIIFNTGGLVSIPNASVLEGATYDITEDPSASLSDGCEYKTFVGWTTASSIADASVKPSLVTSVTMSTSDVTLYAVYSKTEGSGSGDYELVESDLGTDWAGDYLIAYSSSVFADGRVGGTGTGGIGKQYQKANPGDNLSGKVVDATWGDTYYVTLEEVSENSNTYLLKTQDGQYNYTSSNSNGLSSTSTRATAANYPITVTYSSSSDIRLGLGGTAAGAVFRYNAAEYFRYYKDCGQEAVYLYKKSSGTTTYSLSADCNKPRITVSLTEIDFGNVKVGGTYTETFTVSGENLTGAINLAVSGAQSGKYSVSPATLSPTAGTIAETTITVTFAPTASSDHAAQVDITSDGATPKTVSLHAISKWEVTWKNDGTVYKTTLVQGGQKPTFPATPTSCDTEESNQFYGWTDAEWPGKIDNVSAKTIHKSNATMPNASNNTTIYYAVFVKRTGSVDDYTDNLTRTTTGISSGSSYGAWSGKSASNTGHSSAVYAGQSAGGNDAIQLRATSPSGIITTTSGGKAKKVTVVWNSNTADGRTLDIYGKSTAYTAASDLYAAAATTQGTKIGSIVYGTSTELTITDDYEYIGIRSNSNALYLDKISIDWQDGEYTYSKCMTNCCDYYITVAEPTKTGTGTGTVAFASGGSAVAAGSDVATCAGTTTITATVTPNPGHQCDALSFTGGSVSVSPAIPDPFVPFDNAGATTYTLTFAQNTNATLATAVTFTQLHDYYIDYMHDNAKVTKNGNYGTAPSLSSTTPGDGCAGSHYKFVGWVPESDMNKETGVPTTTSHMVAGGQTGMYATGTNYYAIWAEEVTP